ncbi:MAG: hypothetical protein U0703_26435, partial [Anaerolineae bacterium]
MSTYIDHTIPVVVVCNISETFYEFLSRGADAERHIRGEQYRGDRAIVWAGDPKLVFTSLPIPHAEHLYQQAGYAGTEYHAPQRPTSWLSLDILREPTLLQRLIDYAGERRTVQLIPYAATDEFLQLVEALQAEHGLTVLLPESPTRDGLWMRDYIDSKIGFRILASRWLPDAKRLLPEGLACQTLDDAAE